MNFSEPVLVALVRQTPGDKRALRGYVVNPLTAARMFDRHSIIELVDVIPIGRYWTGSAWPDKNGYAAVGDPWYNVIDIPNARAIRYVGERHGVIAT